MDVLEKLTCDITRARATTKETARKDMRDSEKLRDEITRDLEYAVCQPGTRLEHQELLEKMGLVSAEGITPTGQALHDQLNAQEYFSAQAHLQRWNLREVNNLSSSALRDKRARPETVEDRLRYIVDPDAEFPFAYSCSFDP